MPSATTPLEPITYRRPPMRTREVVSASTRWITGSLAVAAAVYGANAACTWLRYGRVSPAAPADRDALLDTFMPQYDVVDRMQVKVHAPAEVTLAAAEQQD